MSYGRALLVSVFLITIVSSINIVDARRIPAAKKKTATLTPESFLESDQDFGIEVRINDYGAGLGGPLAASTWKPQRIVPENLNISDLLEAIPDDRKDLFDKIGKIDGLELTYDKTNDRSYYVIITQGKTDDQIKETIRLVKEALSTRSPPLG